MPITINGKSVYSNKVFSKVVGTRVNFMDGSWCDVATGESVNNGPGYITIYDENGNVISSQSMSAGGSCRQVAIGRNVVQQQSGGINIITNR